MYSKKTKNEHIADVQAAQARIAELEGEDPRRPPEDLAADAAAPDFTGSHPFYDVAFEAIILTENGRCLDVNQAMTELFGYTRQECLGRHATELIAEYDRDTVRYNLLQERAEPYRVNVVHKDGRLIPAEVRGRNIRINGRTLRATAIRDISEQVRAEDALRDAELEKRIILDMQPNHVVLQDTQHRILWANTSALTSVAGEVQDLEGKPCYEAWALRDDVCPDCPAEISIRTGKSAIAERTTPDGRMWRIQTVPIFDENANITRILEVSEDITEPKKTEKALRRSEALYRGIFENATDGIVLFNRQGRIQATNQAFRDLLRYSEAELADAHILDFIPKDELERLPDVWLTILAEGSLLFERTMQSKPGRRMVMEVSAKKLGPDLVLCLYREVTDKKEALERLQQSEERYRRLLEHSPIAVVVHVDETYVYVNPAAVGMLGAKSEDDLLGRKFWDVIPEASREVIRKRSTSVYDKGTSLPIVEVELKGLDGRRIFAELATTSIDYMGKPAAQCMMRDITERRKTEEALRKSEEVFRSVVAHSPLGFGAADVHGKVLECNRALAEILECTQEEVLGTYFTDFTHPEDLDREWPQISMVLEGKQDVYAIEKRYIRKDGTPVWVQVFSCVIRDGHEIRFSFAFIEEITHKRKHREELKAAKETAEAANRSKSLFLANMSHELRTPLNGIIGMLQLMQKESLTEDLSEYLNLALQSGKRLTALLGDILDLSKIEAGKVMLCSEEFYLSEVLKAVDGLFRIPCDQSGLELKIHTSPDLPQRLLGDELRLRQILFNLVGNAVKFTSKGGVELSVESMDAGLDGKQRMQFTVRDTGMGIHREYVDKIFESFTQTDQSLARKHQGAGLGLSIVKSLVDLMGGTITVESRIHEGTTFCVVVPFLIAKRLEQPQSTPTVASLDVSSELQKVLVVEDDPTNRLTLVKTLEGMGMEVHGVENGERALEALLRNDYDVVFMDIQLPIMDGVEATKRIRTDPALKKVARIPIVAFTAYAMEGDRERFLDAGMDYYLAKPVVYEDLLDVIDSLRRR